MSDLTRRRTLFFFCLFAALVASRLCHLHILWAEEGYGSAGAVQILHGKMIYRDFWFDKPPLAALLYVLWGGSAGWALRVAGSVFGLVTAFAAWRCASALWSESEGYWAAGLVTFFLIFDLPPTVMTMGPDLILVPLAFAAVSCVLENEPVWAGLSCVLALQVNAKALLIVAVVLIWSGRRSAWKVALAFVAGTTLCVAGLAATGSLPGYWEQVWAFGNLYARDTFVEHPLREGIVRTLNWTGFHLALVVPAIVALLKDKGATRVRFLLWLCLAAAGVWAGERFFPRYFLILVPPLTLLSSRGYVLLSNGYRKVNAVQSGTEEKGTSTIKVALISPAWRCLYYASLLLLLVPLIRFGPRYATLGSDLIAGRTTQWSDVVLNQDSQEVASVISTAIASSAMRDPTLLVWGYRPDLFAYTKLAAATPYLDSQLLTGVIADRHLTTAKVSLPDAARNRLELINTSPVFIVDGLGPLNPQLAITHYPELQSWLANYSPIHTTRDSVLYVRR